MRTVDHRFALYDPALLSGPSEASARQSLRAATSRRRRVASLRYRRRDRKHRQLLDYDSAINDIGTQNNRLQDAPIPRDGARNSI